MELIFELDDINASMPKYSHPTDSGMDIAACECVQILPGSYAKIDSGVHAKIPEGYELQVRPRSGLSSHGILAAFGTIDEAFRGGIGIILYNFTNEPFIVNVGDRIAQLVLAPVARATIKQGTVDTNTDRGVNGFGSTGR